MILSYCYDYRLLLYVVSIHYLQALEAGAIPIMIRFLDEDKNFMNGK